MRRFGINQYMRRVSYVLLLSAVFTVLTVLFFENVIFSDLILSFRDLGRFFYPPRELAFQLLRHGTIPFWNPYILCGNPLLASHQAAVFYPVSIVYLLGDFMKMFNVFIYIHFILAGLFMHLFLRGQGLSKMSSLTGSVTFAFSGYMLAAVNVLTFFSSGIWLPLALWAFFKAVSENKNRYIVLTSISLGIMFLAGEPMILYMTCAIMALYSAAIKKIMPLVKTIMLFSLLFAFQILPVAELLMQSDRVHMSYKVASTWGMAPYNFLNLIFPAVTDVEMALKDYWEKQSWLLDYYLGLWPIIMLPIAVFFARGRNKALALSILVISVILSLGKYTPLHKILFDYLPGFNLFRYPVKYFYLTTFALSWLGAMGYDHYERNVREDVRLKKTLKNSLYLAFFLSLLLLFIDRYFLESVEFLYNNWVADVQRTLKDDIAFTPYLSLGIFTIRRTLVFVLIFIVTLFLGIQKRVRTILVSLMVLLIVIIDLSSAYYDINLSESVCDFKKITSNMEFLLKDKSLFRIISGPGNMHLLHHPTKEVYKDFKNVCKERLYTNRMMEFGIYDINGYEAVTRSRVGDLNSFILCMVKSPDDINLLSAMNVKYIASPKILNLKGYKLVKESPIANLYENKNVLPRAFLSDKALVIRDRVKIFQKFCDKGWDPLKEVILEEEPAESGQMQLISENQKLKDKADIVTYKPNEVTIDVSINSPKFLVLSDSYYPGWRAYVDGKRAKIYQANYIMRALYIDAGHHRVRFVFIPFSFWFGLAISLLTALILLIYFVFRKNI